jgi:ABC-type transporter Mla subunit MlaD
MVVFCLLAVGLGPFAGVRLARSSQGLLITLADDLDSTAESLRELTKALGDGKQVLDAATGSLESVEETLGQAQPVLDSTVDLLTENAPQMIDDTQQALTAAEEGAAAVDQMLRALDAVSFLTGVEYDPEQPLDEGIADAAASLDPLQAALSDVGQDLADLEGGLSALQDSLGNLNENLADVSTQLEGQTAVLIGLAGRLEKFSDDVDQMKKLVRPAAAIIILVWGGFWVLLGISQSALIYLGRSMRGQS